MFYETPIKNTALYLKAITAGKLDHPLTDKLLRWLLSARDKDGAWASTSNTLAAVDAFTDYLNWKQETQSNFSLELWVNNASKKSFTFAPETVFTQVSSKLPISDLVWDQLNLVRFEKTALNSLPNAFYYSLALKYYLPAKEIPSRDEGFALTRAFYSLDDKENKRPLDQARLGEVLREHLQVTIPVTRNFVGLEDYIPAGVEIVNLDLATEQKSLTPQELDPDQGRGGRELYPSVKEFRDTRAFLYFDSLEPGVYEYDFFVRALIPGTFTHLPSQISEMYFPENFGRTQAGEFRIVK